MTCPTEPEINHEELDIFYLVHETLDFIVYIDSTLTIECETTTIYDKNGRKNPEEHNQILNCAASIECIPNEHQSQSIRINFKRMVGEGIARSLKDDYVNAQKILDEAFEYITKRNIERARYWQLSTINITGFIFVFAGLILWYFRSFFYSILGETGFFCILASCAGAVGANLSFILRIGQIQVTSEAEKKLHVLESISRILAGAISGFIISILIRLGILIPVFGMAKETYIAMVAGGFFAGVSERLVPSLIAQFENRKNGENDG